MLPTVSVCYHTGSEADMCCRQCLSVTTLVVKSEVDTCCRQCLSVTTLVVKSEVDTCCQQCLSVTTLVVRQICVADSVCLLPHW